MQVMKLAIARTLERYTCSKGDRPRASQGPLSREVPVTLRARNQIFNKDNKSTGPS